MNGGRGDGSPRQATRLLPGAVPPRERGHAVAPAYHGGHGAHTRAGARACKVETTERTTRYNPSVGPILYLGGVAGAAGFVVALGTGRTRRRIAVLITLGAVLAFSWLLVVYFSAAPADESPHCSDCYVYLGRWWEPGFALFIIGANLAAWLAGVLLGAGLRVVSSGRRRL